MGARAPYGYLKPDEDVTSLVINPETAPVVKMIFQKYLNGMNITQLARYLNEQKIMSPGQYKREVLKTGVKKQQKIYLVSSNCKTDTDDRNVYGNYDWRQVESCFGRK